MKSCKPTGPKLTDSRDDANVLPCDHPNKARRSYNNFHEHAFLRFGFGILRCFAKR